LISLFLLIESSKPIHRKALGNDLNRHCINRFYRHNCRIVRFSRLNWHPGFIWPAAAKRGDHRIIQPPRAPIGTGSQHRHLPLADCIHLDCSLAGSQFHALNPSEYLQKGCALTSTAFFILINHFMYAWCACIKTGGCLLHSQRQEPR
jgi:hypothetical protein